MVSGRFDFPFGRRNFCFTGDFRHFVFFYVWFDRVSVLAERPDQPFL